MWQDQSSTPQPAWGFPCAIHEQNAFPGVTNKMLAKEVDHVMLTVEKALEFFHLNCPYTVTGLPVRGGISGMDRAAARKQLGFDDGMCILSFGGSLGAGCINEAMAKVIPWHVQKGLSINHIHGYGGMGKETFPKAMAAAGIPLKGDRLRITEYINDMDVCLAAADLVICRSGASTLAELEAAGRGSILIRPPSSPAITSCTTPTCWAMPVRLWSLNRKTLRRNASLQKWNSSMPIGNA